jgi:hypothetical protein
VIRFGFLAVLTCWEPGHAATGTCDIYRSGGTPCVAAYSTVRALYGNYAGSLYQVRNASGGTKDIGVLSAGGVANSAAQDSFCTGTTCTISILYDQSANGNDLTKAPGGNADYGPNPDIEAVADSLPVYLGGHKAYGLHITPNSSWTGTTQVGYRNTNAKGTARNDDPETIYEVTDGTYYDGACCFDFGNAEMQAVAGGDGYMEALYFGNVDWWDKGAGNGPWIMADLEVGVYSQGGVSGDTNSNDGPFNYPFVTAMLKGNTSTNTTEGPFTLEGGNATSGTLKTVYSGAFPTGYSPMHRQGGIVLGVGGDNSGTSKGNFYEGVMTTGYASAATDAAVQANIVAAGYGVRTLPTAVVGRELGEMPVSVRHGGMNGTVTLDFDLEAAKDAHVVVVDLQGREVAKVFDGKASSGRNVVVWNARNVPSGAYAMHLDVAGQTGWSGKVVVGH